MKLAALLTAAKPTAKTSVGRPAAPLVMVVAAVVEAVELVGVVPGVPAKVNVPLRVVLGKGQAQVGVKRRWGAVVPLATVGAHRRPFAA